MRYPDGRIWHGIVLQYADELVLSNDFGVTAQWFGTLQKRSYPGSSATVSLLEAGDGKRDVGGRMRGTK